MSAWQNTPAGFLLYLRKDRCLLETVRERIVHLQRCRGISRRFIYRLLQQDPSLKEIYNYTPAEITRQFLLPHKNASLFYSDLHNLALRQRILDDLKKFKIITIVDESYSPVLNTIKDAPLVLYALGDTSLLSFSPALSVIGTRKPSPDAVQKMELIVKPLLKENCLIVSGMAKGIDSLAHKIALAEGGKTIAVLGSGFHHIYPKQNISLFHQIARKGLVLTEYPPDTPPVRYHFPERNRIISGLSYGTLVIEATERSGTLITVEQALDQGREVYAVPGSPAHPQTKGCHRMIQDGAKLVHEAADIKEDWQ
ncbi:DNA-processing protein DprA [Oceanobacillus massiliensis]|uniref:DNA-processing protein DprA n=1 Tax=Oceanobacillus massiliensis TaxID=1465765 RepID=UPI0002E91D31|nr:DNA-processing protein DprA [Oceanobacillus massiliensis]